MNFRAFYLDLLNKYFSGELSREEISDFVSDTVPIDVAYQQDAELMINCEWGIRHVSHGDLATTDEELRFYRDCLTGEVSYSDDARNEAIRSRR